MLFVMFMFSYRRHIVLVHIILIAMQCHCNAPLCQRVSVDSGRQTPIYGDRSGKREEIRNNTPCKKIGQEAVSPAIREIYPCKVASDDAQITNWRLES